MLRIGRSLKPGNPRSTTKAQTPRAPFARSSVANVRYHSARPTPEIQIFAPFSTYSSPRRTTVVSIAATSVPECGSVTAVPAKVSPRASGTR